MIQEETSVFRLPINALSHQITTYSNYRKKYLQQMETLDRAKTHYQSLKRAEERGKTPASMAIMVRPNVMDKMSLDL